MVKRLRRSPLTAETGVRTSFDGLAVTDEFNVAIYCAVASLVGTGNKPLLQFNTHFYALMVKRLRRSPLTAETGVRFPVGVPNKT